MLNWLLTFIAYGSIMFVIVICYYGMKLHTTKRKCEDQNG